MGCNFGWPKLEAGSVVTWQAMQTTIGDEKTIEPRLWIILDGQMMQEAP